MKLLVLVLSLAGVALCADDGVCQRDDDKCEELSCDPRYGGHLHDSAHLTNYVNLLLKQSFTDLMTGAQFETHERFRPGFSKLFSKLSDAQWEDATKVLEHMHKRGLALKENAEAEARVALAYERTNEVSALAEALDKQKLRANKAFELIKHDHDPELVSFFENNFLHKDADRIRDLAGHVRDVDRFISDATPALGIDIFDSYLQDKYN